MLPRSAFAGLAVVLVAAPAVAGWSGEVGVATDFIHRGFTRSEGEPVLQAGIGYRSRSGFIADLWGSTVRFAADYDLGDEREIELHGVIGYAPAITEDWTLTVLLRRYEYPGADAGTDFSYTEAELGVLYRRLLRFSVAYTDAFTGGGSTARFTEISGRYPLARFADLTAGLGRAEFGAAPDFDYGYGHVGVARSIGRLDLELGYYHADARALPRWGAVVDGSWVLSLSYRRAESF